MFLKNLFIFGCTGSLLLCEGFLWGATHCSMQASQRGGFLLQSTDSRHMGFNSCSSQARERGSAVGVHRHIVGVPRACGISPEQGSNMCSLHWQMDSQPLDHQGSPRDHLLMLGL